jgi:DNA-directed RNA polymerase specialized sigma24 family protein
MDCGLRPEAQPPPAMVERFVRLLEPLKGVPTAFCQRPIPRAGDRDAVMQAAVASAQAAFRGTGEGSDARAWMLTHLRNAVRDRCRAQADGSPPRDGSGIRYRGIAAIMLCPMGTVMSLLSRAGMREGIAAASALPAAAAEPLWPVIGQESVP